MDRLTPKEIFQELRKDIEKHPDQYISYLDVFDKLFHIVDEEYADDLETNFFANGVNHTGLPDQFIMDYMDWRCEQAPYNRKGEITDISLHIHSDGKDGWIASFHLTEECKI